MRHIARLNRIYAVLSGINSTIVRVQNRDELFRQACRIATEAGGFRMAWLGIADTKEGRVKPLAWAGAGEDYIGLMPLSLDESDSAHYGLAGRAVRECQAMIANDMVRNRSYALPLPTTTRLPSRSTSALLRIGEPSGTRYE